MIQKKLGNPCTSSTEWLEDILENGNIALVLWKDAATTGGPGWEDAEDIKEAATADVVIVHTVGYVLTCNEKSIALTDTIQTDGQAGGAVHLIPMEMVLEIKALKEIANVGTHDGNQLGIQNGGAS